MLGISQTIRNTPNLGIYSTCEDFKDFKIDRYVGPKWSPFLIDTEYFEIKLHIKNLPTYVPLCIKKTKS